MPVALPFALLLQAATEATEEGDGPGAEELVVTLEESTLLGLLLEAGPVGFVVFAILGFMSVLSWAIAYSKYRALASAESTGAAFQRALRRTGRLPDMHAEVEKLGPSPLATIFSYGYEEVARQVNTRGTITTPASVERTLAVAVSRETARLREHLGILATTASSAPFIGLFGTVWGVLDAFRGLGQSSGATLRAVAPGIAEALLATALGLFAAIPALIFYNLFAARVRELRAVMQDFGLEFFNLAERDYGAQNGSQDQRS